MPSLVPLIKCLPRGFWEERPLKRGYILHLLRIPTASECGRMEIYARLIRSLELGRSHTIGFARLHRDVLGALVAVREARSLLPNLLELTLYREEEHALEHASLDNATYLLIGATLTRFSLQLSSFVKDDDQAIDDKLLDTLREKSTLLRTLEITASSARASSSLSLALSRLLCELHHVCTFSSPCATLTGTALVHLASLRGLRILKFKSPDDAVMQSTHLPPIPHRFPALREMTAWADQTITVIALIHWMQPAALEIMVLHINDTPLALHVKEIFAAMEEHFSTDALKRLYAFQDDFSNGDGDNIVDAHALRPLLSFHKLEYLWINACISFQMVDNALFWEMAQAWPHLRELDLGSTSCWGLPSQVTLDGLLAFCAHCPDLQILGLTFDASTDIPSLSQNISCNRQMEVLQVGHSRLGRHQVREVSGFLRHIYPNLQRCSFWDQGNGPGWQATREAWKMVAGILESSDNWY